MVGMMNAIAQASAAPVTGPKLDNRRVAAALVDLIIVAAGAAVVLVAGNALSGDRSEVRGALGFVIIGWALYYFFATESGGGQTLGKKLMKLRVVRADGRPAGMGEIAVRTILRVVDNYLIGLIVMLATGERRQRVGDLAAGTIVVDATASTVAPPAPVTEVVEEPDEDEPAPAAELAEPAPAATITLPSRPAPPTTLSDLEEPEPPAEEPAIEAEPAVEDEPRAEEPVVEAEPAVEDEPRAEEPAIEAEPAVEDEPPAEEPAIEAEPTVEVEVEPTVEVEAEPAVEAEPVLEARDEELPSPVSPSLEELAQDVAAAHSAPEVEEVELVEDAGSGVQAEEPAVEEPADEEPAVEEPPVEESADEEPADDGPVNVKSVETVSAMDLIMGAADEDAAQQSDADSEQDLQGSAS
jgi:uncharacterized RDD family membrane protein YckC